MIEVPKAETKILATIGKCIYCGSRENLSKEHIIPYGLGGNLVLSKASCRNCAKITSRFEMDVLRKQFITLRSARKLPTRRMLPKEFDVEALVKSKSQTETTQISPEYLPIFFPLYDPPAFFDNRPVVEGVAIRGIHHAFNRNLTEHLKGREIDEITHSTAYVGGSFERLLAKAAYGHAVYRHGVDTIKEKLIVPVILGKDVEFNRYVGIENQVPVRINPSALHITNSITRDDGVILGYVRLFGFLQTPVYTVVVGRIH